ncbi:MAG: DUF2314 domain-containing protein [Rhizobacter sp.]|nr:DUF2314 domain-containing protein [Rhizobacter sp.]
MTLPVLPRRWLAAVALAFLWPTATFSAEPLPSGNLQRGPIAFELAIYLPKGSKATALPALRQRLNASGMPTWVDALPKTAPTAPVVHARLLDTVQKDYAPPSLDMLQRFGRGLSRDQAQALQTTEYALILRFAHPTPNNLTAYRAALQLAEQVARDTQGLLWDEETREVFTPDAWRTRRLDSWSGDIPDAALQTVIHAYKGDQQVRAITLGMVKFGLPDVVIDDFSWSNNRPMGNLVNALVQALVEGATLTSPGQYELDLRKLRHAPVREALLPSLKSNANAVARLTLRNGKPESGDPDNRLLEVKFDRYPGPDHYARQDALLSALFGSEDGVTRVKHNEELLAASAAAKKHLPALREAFRKGLQPGEYILLKLPFATPAGSNEWMWVEVLSWDGDTIRALLKNEPVDVPTLHAGQEVKVSQSKVFDYLRRYPDGRDEGNETGRILQRMQGR